MLDSWLQDVRYATRLLRRNPLFSLTAAASLAIGFGANTTIFTIANAMLFKPPAGVVEPGRLVDVGRSQDGSGFDNGSYPNYLDIGARNTVFTGIYTYRMGAEPLSLGGADGAERIFGDMVSTNYFSVLGTRPHIGRLFSPEDGDQPGAPAIAVLSHRFWTRRFDADPAIVGTTVQLNGRPFVVIGVAPAEFPWHDDADWRRLGADQHGGRALAPPLGVDPDQPRKRVAHHGRAAEAPRVRSTGAGGAGQRRPRARTGISRRQPRQGAACRRLVAEFPATAGR
jgi:hypothetical protein